MLGWGGYKELPAHEGKIIALNNDRRRSGNGMVIPGYLRASQSDMGREQ